MLPPMAVAQCALAWTVVHYAWRRYAGWVTGLIALGFLILGSVLMVGALSEYARLATPMASVLGWRQVDRAKIVTFLWCFSSSPAIVLFFITRFAANRVSPEHQ